MSQKPNNKSNGHSPKQDAEQKSTKAEVRGGINWILILVVGALSFLAGSYYSTTKNPVTPVQTSSLKKAAAPSNIPEITSTFARDFPADNKTIWCPFSSNAVEVITECCEWESAEKEYKATLIWVRDKEEVNHRALKLSKGQILNLIEGTDILTNKANLHRLLVRLDQTHLQPETYVIGPSESECKAFFKSATQHPDYIWLTKEPDSARGDGIYVNPDIKKMKQRYLVDPEADVDHMQCKLDVHEKEFLVQRYVVNPLLLNGKKMEIRTYWLIASLEPFIVFYHDGTVRLTTRDYKKDDWSNPLIHITNTAQQKVADPNFWETVADRKWSLVQLSEYLESQGHVTNAKDWLDNELRPSLKNIIKIVAKGAHKELLRILKQSWLKKDIGRYELLGMDVILDDTLHPWLTEVQVGPGLSRDPGVKTQIIPQLIEEMFGIALEVNVRKRFNLPLSPGGIKNALTWEVVDVEN